MGKIFTSKGINQNCEGKLALISGREKGHSDEKDIERAQKFAKGLLRYNLKKKYNHRKEAG